MNNVFLHFMVRVVSLHVNVWKRTATMFMVVKRFLQVMFMIKKHDFLYVQIHWVNAN